MLWTCDEFSVLDNKLHKVLGSALISVDHKMLTLQGCFHNVLDNNLHITMDIDLCWQSNLILVIEGCFLNVLDM